MHGKFVLSVFQAGTVAAEMPTFRRVGCRADPACEQPHGDGFVRQNRFTLQMYGIEKSLPANAHVFFIIDIYRILTYQTIDHQATSIRLHRILRRLLLNMCL
jgi:hypothetical protein